MQQPSESYGNQLGPCLPRQLEGAHRDHDVRGGAGADVKFLNCEEENTNAHGEQEERFFLNFLILALAALHKVVPRALGQLNCLQDRVDDISAGVGILQVS